MKSNVERPKTLAEVAAQSQRIEDFGLLLRDWIHHITRNDVSNRPALRRAIEETPEPMGKRFTQGNVCDAFLAAYAEWIADQANIERPPWTADSSRVAHEPWFAGDDRAALLILAPASFRQRNVFTIPENVVKLRRGRPLVSQELKREKARSRDRRYRDRVRNWIRAGRSSE